jgi:hypothetical protein
MPPEDEGARDLDMFEHRETRMRRGAVGSGSRGRIGLSLVLLGVVGFALGCTTSGGPPAQSGFLEDYERMAVEPERFPFASVWVESGRRRSANQYVLVRRVDTEHLQGIDWAKEQPSTADSEKMRREANGLAKGLWESVRSAFYYDPNRRLTVVDRPRENTAVLEMAIVRVIVDSFGKGTVAFEGRVRDAESGDIVATFADQQTGSRQGIIDQWALWLVELINTPIDHKVGDLKEE